MQNDIFNIHRQRIKMVVIQDFLQPRVISAHQRIHIGEDVVVYIDAEVVVLLDSHLSISFWQRFWEDQCKHYDIIVKKSDELSY